LAASPVSGDASAESSRKYKLVSATYLDKTYPDGILSVNEAGDEVELRQWTGKRKKEETTVARFRLEPNADVLVDGPLLRVSGLSITLESSGFAGEVADLLRRPAREREAMRILAEAEYSVSGFLTAREEALNFLLRVKVDPRGALLSVESLWTADDTDPLDAVCSTYSMRLAESLEKMKSSLADYEKKLGSGVTDRLYALVYTIGAVQTAIFEAGSNLVPELAALQELGITVTAQDMRMEKLTERLMPKAHQGLVAFATARLPSS
jgi:hypothetical protein